MATEMKGLLGGGGSSSRRWGWTRCAVLVAALIGIALTVALMAANHVRGAQDWASGLVAFMPLITAEIVLGLPPVLSHLRARTQSWGATKVWAVALPITFLWTVSGLIKGRGSALSCIFVALLIAGVIGACVEVGSGAEKLLCFTDMLIWTALAAPLDLRWFGDQFWFGIHGSSYDWWAITVSVLIVVGFGAFRDDQFYRLVPRLKDLGIALVALVGVLLTVVPVGLGLKFLAFPPTKAPTVGDVFGTWFGNFVAVGIVEELLFRCLLYRGIASYLPEKRWWIALFLSSVAFGLWHWPRESEWDKRATYMLLAFMAGVFYCLAFRFSGNNILAAVLVHSTTDTLWGTVLKR